ncbi:MAG: phosphoribosyl-ATP diphosphatase [Gammaproteobacteria bacterium]
MHEADVLARLSTALEDRKHADPKHSYVASLYAQGLDAILRKLGEEATETVLAAKNGARQDIIHETADLWFHCLVMLAYSGISTRAVLAELDRRFGLSGLEEKSRRENIGT